MNYDVELIRQTSGMACWAAGIAMIKGWRNHASFDPLLVAQNPGGIPYAMQYRNGLSPNDVYILSRYGLVVETPQSYAPAAFQDMLVRFGPLWVAGATFPIAHVRVVTGIDLRTPPERSIVHVNDPWERGMRAFRPTNQGSRYVLDYSTFWREVEGLARTEMAQPAPVYVAHLP